MLDERDNRENRQEPRFEPPQVEAYFQTTPELRGYVLNASRSGIAIDLRGASSIPDPGVSGHLKIKKQLNSHSVSFNLGKAELVRNWSYNNEGKCVAVKLFQSDIDEQALSHLLTGESKENRLKGQKAQAENDLKNLEAERRYLLDCQMKLFMLTLTAGVALLSAYFGLSYHGMTVDRYSEPSYSFWRTMVAMLPGFLALACAFMAAQKTSSLQRINAFLIIMKDFLIKQNFPREYRGWEGLYRKVRYIYGTKKCDDQLCGTRKCGQLLPNEVAILKERKTFRNPTINFFHLMIFTTFAFIYFFPSAQY